MLAKANLHQWKALLTLAQAKLKAQPDNRTFLRAGAEAAMHLRDWPTAGQYLEKLTGDGNSFASDRMLRAWLAAFSGDLDSASLALLKPKTQATFQESASYLYLLSLAELAAQRVEDAHRTFVMAMDRDNRNQLSPMASLLQYEFAREYKLDDVELETLASLKACLGKDDTSVWISELLDVQAKP